MAPLITITLLTVSSFFSTCVCFLRDGRSFSGDLPPLYLACVSVRMALSFANGDASRYLGLKILRVQGKGDRTDHGTGPGRPTWADQPRSIPAQLGHPLRSCGSSGDCALCPLHLHHFYDVIFASKMEVLRA
jgi:hypothetical protein